MDFLGIYEVLRHASLIQQHLSQLQIDAVLNQRGFQYHQAPLPVAVGPVLGLVLQPRRPGQPKEEHVVGCGQVGAGAGC